MSEAEWTDSPEKVAWRAVVPEAAAAISGYCTPNDQVGDLARILAVEVLNVAYKNRANLMADGAS